MKAGSNSNELYLVRLRKIAGQIQGIEKMLDKDKECIDVIHQIMAVRSSLGQLAIKLITESSCSDTKVNQQKLEYLLKHIFLCS